MIAAEYARVLFDRLRAHENASRFIGKVARHRQAIAAGLLTVVIGSYLGAAQWALPIKNCRSCR